MTLNFFSNHNKPDGKRYDAVLIVADFVRGRGHLPRDLVKALHYLIPELERRVAPPDDDFSA
jgi:hypothetical protein